MSASAALELSVGLALANSGATAPDRVQLALAGQAAEHEYVGTLCGIMDQYIAALGQADAALLIDCRSLETESVPMRLGTARVLVCDTRVKHQLSTSGYNQRRAEATSGCTMLAKLLPGVQSLRDVQVADFERLAGQLPDIERRRCRHVVTENVRTLAAARALSAGDLRGLGQLMLESHASLRDDYEVSCAELDLAVGVAAAEAGVYGSRMTGGASEVHRQCGRGGALERVARTVKQRRGARLARARLFATRACEGARREPSGGGSLAGP